ncbi:hypothetical protein [Anaplasma phagocytophilum]|uniref:hypothetical protein n=1 Tax=Anaplasma phagocytophilum TaxID=948 RepID=UPI00201A9037
MVNEAFAYRNEGLPKEAKCVDLQLIKVRVSGLRVIPLSFGLYYKEYINRQSKAKDIRDQTVYHLSFQLLDPILNLFLQDTNAIRT